MNNLENKNNANIKEHMDNIAFIIGLIALSGVGLYIFYKLINKLYYDCKILFQTDSNTNNYIDYELSNIVVKDDDYILPPIGTSITNICIDNHLELNNV